ncbi:MAG: LPS export ABC transporter permease LptF [Pseudorhodoplanes sp.]
MGSIGRYILRTTLGAFLVVLVSLTAIIWVTQALRDIDLMTSQGQTILVFVGITGLIIPLLILVIAPLALVLAAVHTLNKLSTDSELIVMNAAGMSPWRLFLAFLAAAGVVSLLVAFISAYLAPKGLRELRNWITEVRADLVTNIVQPGRFSNFERGLTFHIRERRPNGTLSGIFVDDRRDPKERITILAEQGTILKNRNGTFLILENGSVQRQEGGVDKDPAVVMFGSYAFDLSRFSGTGEIVKYSVREQYLWDLIWPDPNNPLLKEQPGPFRAEFHDRLLAPFYPLVFVIVTYAFLGAPRTTRQSRGLSVAAAVGAVAIVRLLGFASTAFGVHMPAALALQYVAIIGATGFGLYAIAKGMIIEPPAALSNFLNTLTTRFMQRAATT